MHYLRAPHLLVPFASLVLQRGEHRSGTKMSRSTLLRTAVLLKLA